MIILFSIKILEKAIFSETSQIKYSFNIFRLLKMIRNKKQLKIEQKMFKRDAIVSQVKSFL